MRPPVTQPNSLVHEVTRLTGVRKVPGLIFDFPDKVHGVPQFLEIDAGLTTLKCIMIMSYLILSVQRIYCTFISFDAKERP